MSGDSEQEYFADGMVEDIITALSRFKSLFVIARNSSFTYKGKPVDVRQVGRELGVRYVLEGSVRKASGRVRITGQLIESESNHHVWAERFEGTTDDVFELQDKLTEQVVGAVAPAVAQAEISRAKLRRPESLDAYDLVLRAKSHYHQVDFAANQEGMKSAYRAIELAPTYAEAHAIACDLYTQRNVFAMPFDREREIPEAIRLARRALVLSPDDPEVLAAAALAIGNLTGDLTSLGMIARATDLNPNFARGFNLRGAGCMFLGEAEQTRKGIDYCLRAMRLAPLDPYGFASMINIAHGYNQLEQFEDAYAWAERAYEANEISSTAYIVIVCATLSSRHERSREVLNKLLASDPAINIWKLTRGITYWRGEKDRQRVFDALRLAGMPE